MIYLYRTSGLYNGVYRPAGSYHLLAEDGITSKCGGATKGKEGYMLVEKEKVLRSRLCNNCAKGWVTRS